MPIWLNLLLAAIAGVAAIGLLAGVMLLADRSSKDADTSALSSPESPSVPISSSGDVAAQIWPESWTHDAPDKPLTADEAHRETQIHRTCRLDGCARKAAVPDADRGRTGDARFVATAVLNRTAALLDGLNCRK